jgi:hypothetical protein
MKATKENLHILKKLGFSPDIKKTKNPSDKDWYSLNCGWGFRLDAVKDFKELMNNAIKYNPETNE